MLYPFDQQLCFIELQLNDRISLYAEFDEQNSTIDYVGKNKGLEYDVSRCILFQQIDIFLYAPHLLIGMIFCLF